MSGFDGVFTETIRLALRLKREELHLSRYALSKYLGIDAVTLQRWECGPSQKCIGELRGVVEDFLAGRLDVELRGRSNLRESLPVEFQEEIGRIIVFYLSSEDEKRRQQMLKEICRFTEELESGEGGV